MGISLGLVGLGIFGSKFADLFKSHPLVDRIALCDREPERVEVFARKEWWRDKFSPEDAYGSLDEICASDLDALVIITQPWLHAPQCVQAMEAGKHVYSAVPVISIPDGDEILEWCDKLVETVRRTGLHYMMGETTYYRPQTMYCRRRAREGAFGDFVYSEGEYLHDHRESVLPSWRPSEAEVAWRDFVNYGGRYTSQAGLEWQAERQRYAERGVQSGPMHYPTHSTSGPISVMDAHAVKVCAWGQPIPADEPDFRGGRFRNETALYFMSNGATMRICEHRLIGHTPREILRVYGTDGCFENDTWTTNRDTQALTVEEMRDPLPEEVVMAFQACSERPGFLGGQDFYGGHGGSHAYLVHEFVEAVAQDRTPAVNVWEAVRYMAAGVMAHKSALRDGEVLEVPDWGDAPA